MSRGTQRTDLKSLVKSTLALLLDDVNTGDNREQLNLAEKLDGRFELLRRRNGINNKLLTSLMHLKSAVIHLSTCFENINDGGRSSSEENSTNQNELPEAESARVAETGYPDTETEHFQNDSQSQLYTQTHVQLQKEVSQIKSSNKFVEAMKYFNDSKVTSAEVFKNENERETKITATKIRVVSEILGNLTNLRGAAEKCMEYISELHKIFNLRRSPFPTWYKALSYVKLEKVFESQEMKGLDSAMHINVVVFRFIKKFITTPIVMLNWGTIDIATRVCTPEDPAEGSENPERPEEFAYQKIHHPILGEQPPKTNKPDPFSAIDEDEIDSQISAVNCSREVFVAAKNPPIEILRITPSVNQRDVVDEQRKRIILSISVDCVDCQTSNANVTEPTNEALAQSSLSLLQTPCKGKVYILTASCHLSKRIQYFLYVTGMDADGIVQREEEELGFLESPELVQAKIFCIGGEKLIVLNVTKNLVHICNNQGKQSGTIDMTKELGNTYFRKPTIFTISYNGEIVCSEGRNKLAIYNIEEDGSSLKKADELIEVKYVVQAMAFNHESDELIILCHTSVFLEYHLVIYTKAGELKEDIKLQNGNYRDAKLIFNRNGRVVLLDNHKLLHLK